MQSIRKSHPLDLEIAFHQFQFRLERQVPIARAQKMAKDVAEPGDETDDAGVVSSARQRRNAVQAVEEKVRLQLSAQRVETSGRQLGLQAYGRQFAIAITPVQHERGARACRRRVDQQL